MFYFWPGSRFFHLRGQPLPPFTMALLFWEWSCLLWQKCCRVEKPIRKYMTIFLLYLCESAITAVKHSCSCTKRKKEKKKMRPIPFLLAFSAWNTSARCVKLIRHVREISPFASARMHCFLVKLPRFAFVQFSARFCCNCKSAMTFNGTN